MHLTGHTPFRPAHRARTALCCDEELDSHFPGHDGRNSWVAQGAAQMILNRSTKATANSRYATRGSHFTQWLTRPMATSGETALGDTSFKGRLHVANCQRQLSWRFLFAPVANPTVSDCAAPITKAKALLHHCRPANATTGRARAACAQHRLAPR